MKTEDETNPNNDETQLCRLGKKGDGVYGIVYAACDKKNKERTFAVKRNIIDQTGDFVGSIKELDILVRLKGHPHIIAVNLIAYGDPFGQELGGVLSPLNDKQYKDDKIHFVFEEADEDASSFFLKANWSDLKKCMVHLLLALEYCHGKGIIHRDLKPANLLIFNSKKKTEEGIILKVCDFGLSKRGTYQGVQTPAVVTSWYRAPEIMMEENYDERVDLWSVGCIFFEMVTKLPLLHGSPDRSEVMINHLTSLVSDLNINPKTKILPKRRKQSWLTQFNRKANRKALEEHGWNYDLFVDLLSHLLCHANNRYTANQALDHDFFEEYRDYIARVRQSYPPIGDPERVINFLPCQERKKVAKMARRIYSNRDEFTWYSHRILFQAISLFDRYLLFDRNQIKPDKVRLAFTTCLYLAFKYFTTLTILFPFTALYGELSEEEKRWAEEFEFNLLDTISSYCVYQPTLYEAADLFAEILDDNHVKDLLEIYLQGKVKPRYHPKDAININGLEPSQVYAYYRGKY